MRGKGEYGRHERNKRHAQGEERSDVLKTATPRARVLERAWEHRIGGKREKFFGLVGGGLVQARRENTKEGAGER